jgi:hypothetical protein
MSRLILFYGHVKARLVRPRLVGPSALQRLFKAHVRHLPHLLIATANTVHAESCPEGISQ